MAEGVHIANTLLDAADLARTLTIERAANGLSFTVFGESRVPPAEIARIVQAVPATLAPALAGHAFYFVPLAMPQHSGTHEVRYATTDAPHTLIAPTLVESLTDEAICHRNVPIPATATVPSHEGVFISAGILRDSFALAFELFINVGHLFVAGAGIPAPFATLVWAQALADVRGETSQDAWESRHAATTNLSNHHSDRPDEKARTEFIESAFADAVAIYQLSLAVDFDYAELREREYPLLAPASLAERLRLVANLFPPNPGYEFAIRYRRRP